MKLPKLHYFDRGEFIREENWFPLMSPRLLVLLDTFRSLTGKCIISPHKDAIGRRNDTDSQHNVEKWGEVRAVDVFPSLNPNGLVEEWGDLDSDDNWLSEVVVEEWLHIAKMLNFGGFGLYLDWQYRGGIRLGIHLDCRETAEMVKWGRIDKEYVSLEKAMDVL